ncbi:MAG: STAS domain-containing protein [Candidatus Zixiibacteriota bacterium]
MSIGTAPDSPVQDIRVSVAAATGDGAVHVIRVDGTIDTLTSDELDTVLGTLVRQGQYRLVVDLAGVRYVSSAGWGVFVSRLRQARESGGDIKLARMTPAVRDVYDLLEFEGILHHSDQLDAAVAQFGGNGHGGGVPRTAASAGGLSVAQPVSMNAMLASLETSVLQLIGEDPFYTVGELRTHLTGAGHSRARRWAIICVLWRHRLLGRRRRLEYYRRRRTEGSATG